IDTMIIEVEAKIQNVDTLLPIGKTTFYSKFHLDLDRLITLKTNIIGNIKAELTQIKSNLQERKDDLLNSKTFIDITDNSKRLEWCWTIFENFRTQANQYSNTLGTEQTETKRLLRLKEVSGFVTTIQYTNATTRIQGLKATSDTETQNKQAVEEKIRQQITQIKDKERLMKDEEKGALK